MLGEIRLRFGRIPFNAHDRRYAQYMYRSRSTVKYYDLVTYGSTRGTARYLQKGQGLASLVKAGPALQQQNYAISSPVAPESLRVRVLSLLCSDHRFQRVRSPKSNQLSLKGFLSMLSFSLILHVACRAHSSHGEAASYQQVFRYVPIMVQFVDGQGTTRFRSVLSTGFWSGAS